MKKKHLLLITAVFMLVRTANLHAQVSLNTNMATYDYTANGLIGQKEIGEDVVRDPATGNIYVAGEQRKDNAGQGIRIVKYDGGMTQLKTAMYDSVPFSESVARIIFQSNKIYVVCNGIEESTGTPTLLLLKYNTSLVLEKSKWFFTGGYNSPADAVYAASDAIYIACYKRSGSANNFSVLRVNNTFGFINSNIPPVTTFNRIPKDIEYNSADQGVYVCGGISEIATGKTAVMVMRFDMIANPAVIVGENYGTLKTLKNIYNSIAITGNYVFVAGCEKNNLQYRWTVRKLEKDLNTILHTATHSLTDYDSEALKITIASSTSVTVAGYLNSSTLNQYKAKVAKYDGTLNNPLWSVVNLPFNSVVTDAATNYDNSNGTTAITGFKPNGTNKNMFVYMFDYNTGAQSYNDAYLNRNAGGNKIIPMTGTAPGTYNFIITGFNDKNSGIALSDLRICTWQYYLPIPRLSSNDSETTSTDFKVFPNPSSDVLNIQSSEALKSLTLFDMQGKTVLQNEISDESLTQQVTISHLPKGVYFLRVNEGQTQRIIKN